MIEIKLSKIFLIFIMLFTFSCAKKNQSKKQDEQNLNKSNEPEMGQIIVCNVYFEDFHRLKEQNQPKSGEFSVIFYPDLPDRSKIKSIIVDGPNNYQFKMNAYKEVNMQDMNGYILRPDGFFWFRAIDTKGFLKNGKYTITVTYKSGKKTSMSRILNDDGTLLKKFLNTKISFSPTGTLKEKNTPLNKIKLKWTILSGMDAYYCTRLAKIGPKDYIIKNLSRTPIIFDNIFFSNYPKSGLNKREIEAEVKLKPNQKYIWFTEIVDNNNLMDVNMCIIQKMQFFEIK